MKLSSAKLQYNENGAFVEVKEQISCDITKNETGSRPQWDREGTYTNETINIDLNVKRGYNAVLDGLSPKDEIELKWNNGAYAYRGVFVVGVKLNTKKESLDYTNTYITFELKPDTEIILAARGGEGGHVDDVEVDGISVVHSGIAEIELQEYLKKADAKDLYVNQSTDTSTQLIYARENGTEKTIRYGATPDLGSGTIPTRVAGGNLRVGSPSNNADATPKAYVDAIDAKKPSYSTTSTSDTFKIGIDASGEIYVEEE